MSAGGELLMCLGQIGQVVALDGRGEATVRADAMELRVALITLDEPAGVGDWLLFHSGFALELLSAEEAADALELRAHDPTSATPGLPSGPPPPTVPEGQ